MKRQLSVYLINVRRERGAPPLLSATTGIVSSFPHIRKAGHWN